jgi:hypothetical protein
MDASRARCRCCAARLRPRVAPAPPPWPRSCLAPPPFSPACAANQRSAATAIAGHGELASELRGHRRPAPTSHREPSYERHGIHLISLHPLRILAQAKSHRSPATKRAAAGEPLLRVAPPSRATSR